MKMAAQFHCETGSLRGALLPRERGRAPPPSRIEEEEEPAEDLERPSDTSQCAFSKALFSQLKRRSLDSAFELAMGRVTLEHVDHVAEVNEGVIDGNNVHFARIEGSPGNQASNSAKSVHCDFHHCVSGTRLALHEKMKLSLEQGGAESPW
ncbi:ubiquitin-60S ribosomal protein L40 [Cricetulus griseus]|nr:ubiquitin-60S ribosomal protein L40 [Cricetulus griseus]